MLKLRYEKRELTIQVSFARFRINILIFFFIFLKYRVVLVAIESVIFAIETNNLNIESKVIINYKQID